MDVPRLHHSGLRSYRNVMLACAVTFVVTASLTVTVMMTVARPVLRRVVLPSDVRMPTECWTNATSWSYTESRMRLPGLNMCMWSQHVQCMVLETVPCGSR